MTASKACDMRLQRDIKELGKEPLEGIRVHLHGDNMRRMCLILSPSDGPFRLLHLHLDVSIPSTYPREPPKVTIQTPVPHPNVFRSGFICCDILRPQYAAYDSDDEYYDYSYNGGYSPAYLLKYIFLQMLSFFSSKYVEQEYGSRYELEKRAAQESQEDLEFIVKRFSCEVCGFNKTFDAVRTEDVVVSSGKFKHEQQQPGGEQVVCGLDKLNIDCCLKIMEELDDQEAVKLSQAHGGMKEIIDQHNVLIKRQLVCFYLRKAFQEAVLGVGVEVAVINPSSSSSKRSPAVTAFDLLSYEAFSEHNLRRGIWGEEFSYFLPVTLSREHFLRGESIIRSTLWEIYLKLQGANKIVGKVDDVGIVLNTIPSMMNVMVLNLMKESGKGGGVWKASEKAMQGYCLLFHLFSKLASKWPTVGEEVRRRVTRFVQDDSSRAKNVTPDIGELLTCFLLVKDIDWSTSLCPVFLEELTARNVVWNLTERNLPHLAYLEPAGFVSETRLRETFTASVTSLRLVMFQVSFVRLLRSQLSDMIDHRYGFPSEEMSGRLFKLIKEINDVNDWSGFLNVVGYSGAPEEPAMLDAHVAEMLRKSVMLSEARGYHVSPYSVNELYVLRAAVERDCPAPDGFHDQQPPPVPVWGRSFFPNGNSRMRFQNKGTGGQAAPQFNATGRYQAAPPQAQVRYQPPLRPQAQVMYQPPLRPQAQVMYQPRQVTRYQPRPRNQAPPTRIINNPFQHLADQDE